MRSTQLFTCLLVSFASLAAAQDKSVAQVKAAFEKEEIPKDLGIKFNPQFLLETTFPQSNGGSVPVTAGVNLPRAQTVGPPNFAVDKDFEINLGQRFVVVGIDPDAPSRQNQSLGPVRQFLGSDYVFKSNVITGDRPLKNLSGPITPWIQPSPPAGSGPHRYIFLLYRQPKGFDDQTIVPPGNDIPTLLHFNISSFAEATHLGDPIAGTFFLTGPDATSTSLI